MLAADAEPNLRAYGPAARDGERDQLADAGTVTVNGGSFDLGGCVYLVYENTVVGRRR